MSAPRDIAPSSPHSQLPASSSATRKNARSISVPPRYLSVFLVTPFSHSAACALFRPLPCSDCFLSVGSTVLKALSFSPNEENLRVLSRSRLLLTRNAIVVRFSFHLHILFSLFLVLVASFSFQREPTLSPSLLFQAICHRLPLSLSLSLAFACLSFVSRSILLFFSAREMQEMETRRWKITITDATATASTIQRPRAVVCLTHARTHARIAPTRFKYERWRCTRVIVATCVTVTLIVRRILNRVTLSCIMHTRYYRDPYERAARGGGHVCVCTAVHTASSPIRYPRAVWSISIARRKAQPVCSIALV